MQTLTSCGVCTVIIVFLTLHVTTAIRPQVSAKCTVVHFPDMMNISKCIGDTLKLCGEEREDLKTSSKTLANCLVRSLGTRNFLTIAFRGLVQAIMYAMQASLPGSALLTSPVLGGFRGLFRRPATQHKILFTNRPCNQTVPVSFPDFLLIGDCVRPQHFMCTRSGWMDLRTQVLTSLLSMIVCVMRKMPFFNVLFLLKDMMCAGLKLLKEWLNKIGTFAIAVPVVEFFEVIFRCNAQFGIQSTMERKLFENVGFNSQ